MLDHHIQRSIVYKLAFVDGLRFAELKPDLLDNKLFTYHLKKVVSAGLVSKEDSGVYVLTSEGRRLGTRVLDKRFDLADQADSVLFLVVRRSQDGAWLMYRRKTHPLLGGVGFMHAHPSARKDGLAVAQDTLRQNAGLDGVFRALGGGYFRVMDGDDLESFTHFTLLYSEDTKGDIVQGDRYAEYFWENSPNFLDQAMLPNMEILAKLYQAKKPFFIEETLRAKIQSHP